MKKTQYILMALVALLALASCDSFLDRQEDEQLTEEKIWQSFNYTQQYFYNCWGYLPVDATLIPDYTAIFASSDETSMTWNRAYRYINFGSWNATTVPYDNFNNRYQCIRDCNIFLKNAPNCSDPILESDASRRSELELYLNCVRWARAYSYFLLMRDYGPVFLIGDEIMDFTLTTQELQRPRNTWDECVEYVTNEMNYCFQNLPAVQNDAHLGLPTKGAALAVLSRLHLYSARPLFNGNNLYKTLRNPDGQAIFPEKFDANSLLRQMEKYHVSSFCAPPTIYRFMIREDLSKYDLSALRYCCTAGEALNPAVYEKFLEQTGIHLMEGFGQTETTMTLGTMPWMKPKPGSMGKPNGQYEIDLLRPDGTPCEDGEKGEIVVKVGEKKPVGLFKEYYRDPELTRQAWHDGYYFTGDMAWRDEDGYYWFEGRIDDVIKSSGYRIGPFEVESALMTHPAVVECAITGVPDDIRGMVVKATVVLGKEWKNKAGDSLIKELQQHVKKETAPYKYPRIIEFVDELPKTISGKIRRVEIRNKDIKK